MFTAQKILNSKNRNSSVDVFRGIAILLVVLYHFNNKVSYGYIGVDLFFVISGLLVGGLLIRKFKDNENINFFKFILQRGFKIWPSYYTFLLLGIPLAYLFYHKTYPTQLIKTTELPKYLFFYKNYDIHPDHSVFDQVWSLCVEEHFYVILPIAFIAIQLFKFRKSSLFFFVIGFISLGILLKFFANHAGSFGTHARIDALGWGVLLSLIITYNPLKIKRQWFIALLGTGLLCVLIYLKAYHNTFFYERVIYHSALPFTFFLMILGLYNYNLESLKFFRFIGYYSYNWYLWHPMFHIIMVNYFGDGFFSLISYLVISFLVAMCLTSVVEETFLNYRTRVIDQLFKKEKIAVNQNEAALKDNKIAATN